MLLTCIYVAGRWSDPRYLREAWWERKTKGDIQGAGGRGSLAPGDSTAVSAADPLLRAGRERREGAVDSKAVDSKAVNARAVSGDQPPPAGPAALARPPGKAAVTAFSPQPSACLSAPEARPHQASRPRDPIP